MKVYSAHIGVVGHCMAWAGCAHTGAVEHCAVSLPRFLSWEGKRKLLRGELEVTGARTGRRLARDVLSSRETEMSSCEAQLSSGKTKGSSGKT